MISTAQQALLASARTFALQQKPIVAGVSGGADSMALLFCLWKTGCRVTALCVNHGLRPEAGEEAAMVERYCADNGIPFQTVMVPAAAFARAEKKSPEEAARILRYRALFHLAKEQNGVVAVAHHQSDQAETVFLRLLRGAGATGLSGMEEFRADGLWRPFLHIPKEELLSLCKQEHIPYCQDKSNEDISIPRNFVRHRVLPLCERINPACKAELCRTAARLQADDQLLFKLAGEHANERQAGKLAALPPPLFYRVMSLQWEGLTEGDLEEKHIAALYTLCKKGSTGKALSLPHGMRARLEYGQLVMEKAAENKPFSLPFTGEGVYSLPGRRVVATIVPQSAFTPGLPGQQVALSAITGLALRSRQTGDRFTPMGSPGEKKLKEFFIDKKIPRPRRDNAILLANGSLVLCVLEYTVSEQAKVPKPLPPGMQIYHLYEEK